MLEVQTKDAPGQVGVTSTQLSTMIESALNNALNQRFQGANGQLIALPGTEANQAATMAQEPQNEILKAIHNWTLKPDVIAPSDGQIIFMNKDRSVEVLDNDQFERRTAEMGQPPIAGFVNQLDGIGGLDIPWGSILLGALPGAITSEVIDGLMSPRNADGSINLGNLALKVGIAWVGVQFGDRLIGRRASQFFAGGLLLFVLADLLPIDQWVANIMRLFNRNASAELNRHELNLARQNQGSQASNLDPTQGSDALETLRALQAQRAAA